MRLISILVHNVIPSSVNTEDYLDFIRGQHKMKLQGYDYQMESLKKSYAASFNATQIKNNKLIKSLNDMIKRTFEFLGTWKCPQ